LNLKLRPYQLLHGKLHHNFRYFVPSARQTAHSPEPHGGSPSLSGPLFSANPVKLEDRGGGEKLGGPPLRTRLSAAPGPTHRPGAKAFRQRPRLSCGELESRPRRGDAIPYFTRRRAKKRSVGGSVDGGAHSTLSRQLHAPRIPHHTFRKKNSSGAAHRDRRNSLPRLLERPPAPGVVDPSALLSALRIRPATNSKLPAHHRNGSFPRPCSRQKTQTGPAVAPFLAAKTFRREKPSSFFRRWDQLFPAQMPSLAMRGPRHVSIAK